MAERGDAAARSAPAGSGGSPSVYVAVLLGALGVLLGTVLALNLLLGQRAIGNPEVTRAASDWQQATRGVTYPAPIMNNHAFKVLRLHDRMPDVNAVVFGASSAFGVTGDMFPAEVRAYNFSQSGNSVANYLAEAAYVRAHFAARIKWYFIPLDWSIGFVFAPAPPGSVDLDPAVVLKGMKALDPPLHSKVLDALSLPKIASLGSILLDVMRSAKRWQAFRQVFFEAAGDEYRCPDGSLAKDFDVLYRGKCGGFYYDGSSRFSAWKQIRAQEVRQRTLMAAAPSSKYSRSLVASGGKPNMAYLDAVARLKRELEQTGAVVIVWLPPLIPGMEELLARASHSGASLERLKQALKEWSVRERIVVLDAGRSERFGCEPLEFLDEHHAMKECYRKVFAAFWRDYRDAATTFYPPE